MINVSGMLKTFLYFSVPYQKLSRDRAAKSVNMSRAEFAQQPRTLPPAQAGKMEESMLSCARADDKRIPDRAGRAVRGSKG